MLSISHHFSIELMENNKRILSNTLFLYIRMLFVLVVSLYTSRVVLKTLGVEDYGVYSVVGGFVSMFGFLNASISSCIQRFYNYEFGKTGERGFQRVFSMSCYIELILSVIVLVFLEIIGLWYINHKMVIPDNRVVAANILFQLSTLQMILVMLQAPFSGAILAKEKMDYYAVVGIIDVALKLLIVLLLPCLSHDKLITFGVLMTSISVIDLLLYMGYSIHSFDEMKLRKEWDSVLFKEMLSFSGWNVFGAVAMVGRTQGLNMILNVFFGPLVNAARGIAVQIQGALMGFIGNISIAARPQIVEAYAQENYERSQKLMFSISKVSFLLLFVMALPVGLNIDYILHIWLGETVPDYTAVFTVLLLLSSLIDVLNTPVTILIMASGEVKRYCLFTSFGGLLVMPISYLFLCLEWPPESVFVAGVIVSILVQAISLVELKRITGIPIALYFRKVAFPLFVVVLVCVVPMRLLSLKLGGSFESFFITAVCSVSLVVLVTIIFALSKEEKALLKASINKLRLL